MSSQDYAEMIEIPVSSCETFVNPKPEKEKSKKSLFKKFFKKTEITEDEDFLEDLKKNCSANDNEKADMEVATEETSDIETYKSEKSAYKKPFKWDLVTAQVITIFVLAVGILLTNVFWKDSGINNLLKTVFSETSARAVDDRTYDKFQAYSPAKDLIEVENGVMTVKEGCAVYSPADGKVAKVDFSNDKYSITISHSDNYKTVISGVDYSYVKVGDKVFTSTPVCYSKEGGAEVSMYNENSIITAFSVEEGKIVWQN